MRGVQFVTINLRIPLALRLNRQHPKRSEVHKLLQVNEALRYGEFVPDPKDNHQEHEDLLLIAAGHGGEFVKLAQKALDKRDSIIMADKLVALYKVPLKWDKTPADHVKFKEFLAKYDLEYLAKELRC